jgi:hypothetical protein
MSTNIWVELPLAATSFSLNSLIGAVTLIAGSNITITPSGNNLTIASTVSGGVTSVGLADSTGLFTISGSPVTSSGTLTLASLNTQAQKTFFAAPNGASGAPTFRTIVASDIPTLNQNTTGTASNITASSNSTLTTLSALSLPTSQLLGTVSLTSQVVNVLPAANGGSPPVTRYLYVDKNRTDSFTTDGSFARPFATIGAAISQIITNADNSSHPYWIDIIPGAYAETLTFNSSTLTNITLSASITASTALQNLSVTGITSTANNTQLATLIFNGFTLTGATNLTGDTNGTNFGSTQVLFSSCQFNGGNITLNNVNNVNFYNCQIQGATASTWTNLAFGYMNGAEGFIGGTTLHLVDNPGGNVPSQYAGNYLLMNQTKFYGTLTIDAGSELDSLTSYFGSSSVITNNGTIHSWATNWSSATTAVTLNSGSLLRARGDFFFLPPIVNSGGTLTNQGEFVAANLDFSQIAIPSNPASGHDKLYFKSDDKLYRLNSSGIETLIGPSATTPSMRYYSSSSIISGSLATVTYATQDYDTNSAYSSGVYTVPVAGKYQVNVALLVTGTIALNNNLVIEIQKNSSVVSRYTDFFPATLTDGKGMMSDIINCALNDTIRIQVSSSITGPSIVTSNFDNYLSICKVG